MFLTPIGRPIGVSEWGRSARVTHQEKMHLAPSRPNTNVDAMEGKIVIYSWGLCARRKKSGKKCIFLDAEGWEKPLEHSSVPFSRPAEEANTMCVATIVQFLSSLSAFAYLYS